MTVSLGEEIMLLSLDDATGAAQGQTAARWGVAAGMLLELVLAGRATVKGGRVEVFDPTPTGDLLLDGRLDRLTRWVHGASSSRKVSDWLTREHAKGSQDVVASLVARGLVTEERHRALGVFPVRRYPEADGTVERELRARLASVVLEGPSRTPAPAPSSPCCTPPACTPRRSRACRRSGSRRAWPRSPKASGRA